MTARWRTTGGGHTLREKRRGVVLETAWTHNPRRLGQDPSTRCHRENMNFGQSGTGFGFNSGGGAAGTGFGGGAAATGFGTAAPAQSGSLGFGTASQPATGSGFNFGGGGGAGAASGTFSFGAGAATPGQSGMAAPAGAASGGFGFGQQATQFGAAPQSSPGFGGFGGAQTQQTPPQQSPGFGQQPQAQGGMNFGFGGAAGAGAAQQGASVVRAEPYDAVLKCTDGISSTAFGSNNTVAAGCWDGKVPIWQVKPSTTVQGGVEAQQQAAFEHGAPVLDVTWSPVRGQP